MSLRAEGADLGVNVSVVCPGFIDSNIFQASDMVNIPRIDLVKSIPFKLVETNTAADKILTDVTHNKAIIVFRGCIRCGRRAGPAVGSGIYAGWHPIDRVDGRPLCI